MQRLWSLKTQAGFEPDTSAFIPTRKPDSPWLGVAPQVPSRRQRQELQTKPCRTHFSGLTEKHSFPTSHHESVNSTHRHKGKNTSILLHNKARKKKKTWQNLICLLVCLSRVALQRDERCPTVSSQYGSPSTANVREMLNFTHISPTLYNVQVIPFKNILT